VGDRGDRCSNAERHHSPRAGIARILVAALVIVLLRVLLALTLTPCLGLCKEVKRQRTNPKQGNQSSRRSMSNILLVIVPQVLPAIPDTVDRSESAESRT
jgi:hypothetical protein